MVKNLKIKKMGALALSMLLYALPASAADTLLGQTTFNLKQDEAQAELWGDVLPNGYAHDLLVLVKNKAGKVLTAYHPDIKGGYNCFLQAVQVKPVPKDKLAPAKLPQQVLVSAGQGDWARVSEYRVLDFADLKQVQPLFSATDNLGIVQDAYVEAGKLYVNMHDGKKREVDLPQATSDSKQMEYGGTFSLTAYDLDDDGQEELFATQQLRAHGKSLADVGAVWQLQAEQKWKQSALTIMTTPTKKNGIINDGLHAEYGSVLPRKIVVPGGEATYPVFATQDLEKQEAVNAILAEEASDYLQKFYQGQADMAFQILRKDKLLTVQLISGKTSFVRHHVHFDPMTGAKVELSDILDIKNPELPELLNVLRTQKNIDFTQGLPTEWYLLEKNLFFVKYEDGKEASCGFALGNLHKYLLDKKWLE